jgi:hypothetical protein
VCVRACVGFSQLPARTGLLTWTAACLLSDRAMQRATTLRIGDAGCCTATQAIDAISCAVLDQPLPATTCGQPASDSNGTRVVHVHSGPHPEPPREVAGLSGPVLPPNSLRREEEMWASHFRAPNRSLGVEWLRPGSAAAGSRL